MSLALALRLAMPMGSPTGGGPHPVAPWLLKTGVWNNAGVWLDSATWTEWLLNGGTWADIGVWADTLTWDDGGPYTAGAVIFDPNGDGDCRLENTASISPDTPFVSWAGWVFIPADQLSNASVTFCDLDGFLNAPSSLWNTAGDVSIYATDQDGNDYRTVSAGAVLTGDTWLWLAGNLDVNHAAGSRTSQYYKGDSAIALSPTHGGIDDGNAFVLDFTDHGGFPTVWLRTFGATLYFSEIFVWPDQLIDWSVQANRRLLFSATGKPVDPSAAFTAFGTPAMAFSGDAATFVVNQGPVSFTHTLGTITNAPSSPSD